jgi:hypothetical protein
LINNDTSRPLVLIYFIIETTPRNPRIDFRCRHYPSAIWNAHPVSPWWKAAIFTEGRGHSGIEVNVFSCPWMSIHGDNGNVPPPKKFK